jgi:anti-sigma factor RsiW
VRPDQPTQTAGGIRCAEAIELVTLHLDGALDDHDRGLFERHVDGCAGCTRYVAQIRQTIHLTGRVREHLTGAAAGQPQHDELRAAFVARRGRPRRG